MRTVIVASQAANKAQRIQTDAKTWGELQQNAEVAKLATGNVEAILNPGKVTLNRADAELPEGDFQIFLIPTKNKAGMTEQEAADLGQVIAKAIVDGAAKATSNEVDELKEELIETIESFFNVDLDAPSEGDTELTAALEAVKNFS